MTKKRANEPLRIDDPFASFSEWSTEADDAAYAHLADETIHVEATDKGDDASRSEGTEFDPALTSRSGRP